MRTPAALSRSAGEFAAIAGRVTDADGVPLAGIAVVPVQLGWYGTCTDEDGYYTIWGVPLGTYDIVAGRDFCDAHPYVGQTVEGVTLTEAEPHVPGVDFALALGGSISGWLTDSAGNPMVAGDNIWIGACEESIPEAEWGSSLLCKGVQPDENGFYRISSMLPGNYRVLAAGNESFASEYYDDVRSYYEASLVPVIAGQDSAEINFVLSAQEPILGAWPIEEYVDGFGWDEGTLVTLAIDDPGNGPGVDYSDTQLVTIAEWDPNTTHVQFNFWGIFDLQLGFIVTLTDGQYTKQHIVRDLAISGVDNDLDVVMGTAAPYSHVYVWVYGEMGRVDRHETADASGNWLADFSVPGDEPGEELTFDIVPDAGGEANQVDADGDYTQVNWWGTG